MAHSNQSAIVENALGALSFDRGGDPSSEAVSFLSWMAKAGEFAPPWWSVHRDHYLSGFWKGSNHLSLAIYNAQSKLAGIPFVIEPVDPSIVSHQEQAERVHEVLTIGSEYGEGIDRTLERFYEDLLTQDNGAFMEIIGNGPPDGAILGMPLAVRHLDSQKCTRTSDPIYPVVFQSRDGNRYKLHWTRVIYMSQMTSSRVEMHGVGFCAISRAIDIAQTAIDIIRYKQERLGSRPPNQIIIGKGISANAIMTAVRQAESDMSDRGFSRYSRSIAIGSDNPDIDLEIKNLHHIDPFDEKTGITYAMYGIASAFGIDVTEIWPVAGSAPSGSSAKLQHMRARGKLPAQVTEALAHQFNTKFLPSYLRLRFDFRDDEEDQQRALIRDIRGRQRERDIGNGTITVRTARQAMMRDGDIPRPVFREMEWSSGRLENGLPLHSLFFTDEEPHATMLNLGVPNPFDFGNLDKDQIYSAVAEAKARIYKAMSETRSENLLDKLLQDHLLLENYSKELDSRLMRLEIQEAEEEEAARVAEPPAQPDVESDIEDDEEHEGDGSSSLGRPRRPAMEKGKEWLSSLRQLSRSG